MDLRSWHEHSTQRCRYRLWDKLGVGDCWVLLCSQEWRSVFWHCWAGRCNFFFPPLPVRGKTIIAWKVSAVFLTLLKCAKLKLISGLMKWCSVSPSSLANRCISLVSSYLFKSPAAGSAGDWKAKLRLLLSCHLGLVRWIFLWIFSASIQWVLCSTKHICTGYVQTKSRYKIHLRLPLLS